MNTDSPPPPPRGILGLPGRLPFTVRRFLPDDEWAWCVERFWVSSWDLPEGRAAVSRILPHPSVNITLESGSLVVTGVAPGVFSRRLTGRESVFGIKFQPGAFRQLSAVPVRSLSGVGQGPEGVLPDHVELTRLLNEASDDDERARVTQDYLRSRDLHPTETLQMVQQAVVALVHDRRIGRIGQAADLAGVSERTLQRLFLDYVGVTPGWVLRRGRLHAAADRVIQLAMGGRREGFADVAAEFGYADQAHFSRDFRRVLGVPPAGWAAELIREEPAPPEEVLPASAKA